MKEETKEIVRKHWGIIKQSYPADKKVSNNKGYETISSEYSDWMTFIHNQLFEMAKEIESKLNIQSNGVEKK